MSSLHPPTHAPPSRPPPHPPSHHPSTAPVSSHPVSAAVVELAEPQADPSLNTIDRDTGVILNQLARPSVTSSYGHQSNRPRVQVYTFSVHCIVRRCIRRVRLLPQLSTACLMNAMVVVALRRLL